MSQGDLFLPAATALPLYDERQILYNLVVSLYNRPGNHESQKRLRKVPTKHCTLEYGMCPRLMWVLYTVLVFVPIVNVLLLILFCVWLYYLFCEYSVIMRNNRKVKDPFQYLVVDQTLDSLYVTMKTSEAGFQELFPGRPLTAPSGELHVTYVCPELRTNFEQIILIGFCTYLYVLAMVTVCCVSLAMDVLWYIATTHQW